MTPSKLKEQLEDAWNAAIMNDADDEMAHALIDIILSQQRALEKCAESNGMIQKRRIALTALADTQMRLKKLGVGE